MLLTNEQFDQVSEFREKVMDHHDIFNLPTTVTLGSLGLVLNGCRKIDTIKGVNQIVLGRGGDLVDGFLARILDQETDTGAFVDTAADKTGMGAIAIAAWRKDAIPRVPLTVIAGKQALNIGLTAITAHNHPNESFRPNPFGKAAMAADNATFISYLYSNALELERPDLNLHQGFEMLGRTAFAAGSALSVPATLQYANRAFTR